MTDTHYQIVIVVLTIVTFTVSIWRFLVSKQLEIANCKLKNNDEEVAWKDNKIYDMSSELATLKFEHYKLNLKYDILKLEKDTDAVGKEVDKYVKTVDKYVKTVNRLTRPRWTERSLYHHLARRYRG
jgi:nitrate/nitrite-specific signal transduction histidine kinase